jgi:hypothetical protein
MSKDIVDSFEKEYNNYLKGFYYGDVRTYPENLQEKVKENEKKLTELKKGIMDTYNEKKGFFDFLGNISIFLDREFTEIKEKNQPETKRKNDISLEKRDIEKEIKEKKKEQEDMIKEKKILEEELKTIENKNFFAKTLSIGKIQSIKTQIGKRNNLINDLEKQTKDKEDREKRFKEVEETIDFARNKYY